MGRVLRVWVVLVVLVAVLLTTVMAYSLFISLPQFDQQLEQAVIDSVPIAATEDALTFARYDKAGNPRVLLVTRVQAGVLHGVEVEDWYPELASNPMALYNAVGYQALAALFTTAPTIAVPLEQLLQPMEFSYPFVAVGTNYKEHAQEVYVDDPPFLFPKLAPSSNWNASVDGRSSTHLDYEAEICLLPLTDINAPDDDVTMALILCNDFTDRWILLRELKLAGAMGTTGFATAKGKAGYLPVGYLLVIPRSPEFYRDISLQLYVNDSMRQNIHAEDMIFKPADIVRETFKAAEQTYYRGEDAVALLPQGNIRAGTLLLSGTGGGVIFKPLNAWNPLLYLKAGDRVITVANYLGHLDNQVVGLATSARH